MADDNFARQRAQEHYALLLEQWREEDERMGIAPLIPMTEGLQVSSPTVTSNSAERETSYRATSPTDPGVHLYPYSFNTKDGAQSTYRTGPSAGRPTNLINTLYNTLSTNSDPGIRRPPTFYPPPRRPNYPNYDRLHSHPPSSQTSSPHRPAERSTYQPISSLPVSHRQQYRQQSEGPPYQSCYPVQQSATASSHSYDFETPSKLRTMPGSKSSVNRPISLAPRPYGAPAVPQTSYASIPEYQHYPTAGAGLESTIISQSQDQNEPERPTGTPRKGRPPRNRKCRDCKREFKGPSKLKAHQQEVRNNIVGGNCAVTICPWCGKDFVMFKNRVRHQIAFVKNPAKPNYNEPGVCRCPCTEVGQKSRCGFDPLGWDVGDDRRRAWETGYYDCNPEETKKWICRKPGGGNPDAIGCGKRFNTAFELKTDHWGKKGTKCQGHTLIWTGNNRYIKDERPEKALTVQEDREGNTKRQRK